jgi:hypothetical protein
MFTSNDVYMFTANDRQQTRPPFGGYALAETAAKWRMSWPVI